MIDMTKLSDAMVKALRALAADAGAVFPERTGQALRRRFLITDAPGGFRLTQSGAYALSRIEHAEQEAAYQAEKASRPVPAQIGEPSAARPLVLDTAMGNGCDCDQDGCPVCFPVADDPEGCVPQAWVGQLATLLDAGARVVKTDRGWRVDQRLGSIADAFLYQWERLDVAATEAIRLGIAEALPPTPGQGVVRLALVKHVYKSHPYRSECRTPVSHRSGHGYEPCGRPAKNPLHR